MMAEIIKKSVKIVEIGEIDIDDDRYIFTYGPLPDELRRSIKEIGVINPPILQEKGRKKSYRIVCGSRRIKIAGELGLKSISACVVDANADDFLLLKISIHDNCPGRSLNPVEQALALDKLSRYLDEREIVHHYMPLLGVAESREVLKKLRKVGDLPSALKDGVAAGVLDWHIALRIASLDQTEKDAIMGLITRLAVGPTKQKALLDLVCEIASREGKGIDEVMQPYIESLPATATKAERVRKAEELLKVLNERRYPTLLKMRKKFEMAAAKLDLPGNIVVKHDEDFEKGEICFSFSIKDPSEMGTVIEKLREISESDDFNELFV